MRPKSMLAGLLSALTLAIPAQASAATVNSGLPQVPFNAVQTPTCIPDIGLPNNLRSTHDVGWILNLKRSRNGALSGLVQFGWGGRGTPNQTVQVEYNEKMNVGTVCRQYLTTVTSDSNGHFPQVTFHKNHVPDGEFGFVAVGGGGFAETPPVSL